MSWTGRVHAPCIVLSLSLFAFLADAQIVTEPSAQPSGLSSAPAPRPAPSSSRTNSSLELVSNRAAVQAIGSPLQDVSASAQQINTAAVMEALQNTSRLNPGNNASMRMLVQSSRIFPTVCTFALIGKSDSTGISSASLKCSGPQTPVRVAISADLQPFQADFEGVATTTVSAQNSNALQFTNIQNLTILNSTAEGLNVDAVGISGSSMQIVGSRFINNVGGSAGGLTISGQSSVLLDSTEFANNRALAGAALMVYNSTVAITNCSFFGNSNKNSQGGALAVASTSTYIQGTTFYGNDASRGGAVYQKGGATVLRNSQLVGNAANTTGGCMYTIDAALYIFNTTFRKNAARTLGGALGLDQTNFTISQSTLDQNTASSQGGAVFMANSTGNITSCTFSSNAAGSGGGLFQYNTIGDVVLCLFQNNTVTQTGGALLQTRCTGNLMNSSFTGNSARTVGGAVLQSNGASSISYTVFQGNRAQDGGSLYRTASLGDTVECSFANNTATRSGGAMYINNSRGNVRNMLFEGNEANSGSAILLNTSEPEVTGCLFDGSRTAGDAIAANNQAADEGDVPSSAEPMLG